MIDVGVDLAEYAYGVTCRRQITLCGLLIGSCLFQIMLRNSPRRVEILKPRQIFIVEIQHSRGSNQAQFSLQQIGTVDREQRLTFLDVVTDFGEQRDDASLIRREYLYRHVFIEVDAADRLLLSREITFLPPARP